MTTCPMCNFSGLPSDSLFCTECGAKIENISSPPPPQPQYTPPPPPEPQYTPPPPPEPQYTPPPPPEPQYTPPPPPQPPPQPQAPPPSSGGANLVLPNSSTIQLGVSPKAVGRLDLHECVKNMGADPMAISRQHCTILEEGGKYYLEDGHTVVQDKPSGNHTYLNGVDITEKGKQELKNGDVIDLAGTIKLTFTLQ